MRRAWGVALSLGLMIGMLALDVVGADTASAYPDQSCQILVNKQNVESGDSLRVTGVFVTTTGDGSDVHWRVTFNGEVVRSVGSTFTHTFAVPTVTKTTVLKVRAVATNGDIRCDPSIEIVIRPKGAPTPPDSSLPNTGGPGLALVLLGALCLAGGAVVLRAGGRREAIGHVVSGVDPPQQR